MKGVARSKQPKPESAEREAEGTQQKQAQQATPQSDAARRFAVEAARLASATRCHNVAVLDVRGISPVTDYLVIATGTSARQMKTVADQLEEFARTSGYGMISRAGDDGSSNWIALDLFDVVAHVFDQEARMYYDLDGLWGDAPKVEWEPAEAAAATAS